MVNRKGVNRVVRFSQALKLKVVEEVLGGYLTPREPAEVCLKVAWSLSKNDPATY